MDTSLDIYSRFVNSIIRRNAIGTYYDGFHESLAALIRDIIVHICNYCRFHWDGKNFNIIFKLTNYISHNTSSISLSLKANKVDEKIEFIYLINFRYSKIYEANTIYPSGTVIDIHDFDIENALSNFDENKLETLINLMMLTSKTQHVHIYSNLIKVSKPLSVRIF